MARKRSAKYDYICQKCGCACDFERHLGGGSHDMKACKGPVMPILRSEFEAEINQIVKMVRERQTWAT